MQSSAQVATDKRKKEKKKTAQAFAAQLDWKAVTRIFLCVIPHARMHASTHTAELHLWQPGTSCLPWTTYFFLLTLNLQALVRVHSHVHALPVSSGSGPALPTQQDCCLHPAAAPGSILNPPPPQHQTRNNASCQETGGSSSSNSSLYTDGSWS